MVLFDCHNHVYVVVVDDIFNVNAVAGSWRCGKRVVDDVVDVVYLY